MRELNKRESILDGCTNHGCIIREVKGMGTNMICQCNRHKDFSRWAESEIRSLRETLKLLVEELNFRVQKGGDKL